MMGQAGTPGRTRAKTMNGKDLKASLLRMKASIARFAPREANKDKAASLRAAGSLISKGLKSITVGEMTEAAVHAEKARDILRSSSAVNKETSS